MQSFRLIGGRHAGYYVPAIGRSGVDDLSSSATNLAGCPTTTASGSFSLSYAVDGALRPVAEVDTHQVGVGYLGHVFFAHTVSSLRGAMQVTGTWTPPTSVTGWRHLWVHIPSNGATTFQADYKINTGLKNYHRVVNQRWNRNAWVDLGIFQFGSGASVSLSNVTFSDYADGAIDIAWDAIAFTTATKPLVSYVALGDSYQAGEGDEPYYANSDNGGQTTHRDACHRSSQSYPPLLFSRMRNATSIRTTSNTEFHFIACSGAVTGNVSGNEAEWGEVPQLAQGWLDENTTRVTIGIGGNDARFGAIIKACLMETKLHQCASSSYVLSGDPEPLVVHEPKVIQDLGTPLQTVYARIHTLAPNAAIEVVGYPRVIAKGPIPDIFSGLGCDLIDPTTVPWMRSTADSLNTTISNAAAAKGVGFLGIAGTYDTHEACTLGTEWINATINYSSTGSSGSPGGITGNRDIPGSGSFHPKPVGHQTVANLFPSTFVN